MSYQKQGKVERIGYPLTISERIRGSYIYTRSKAWINAIHTKKGRRKMYIVVQLPDNSQHQIWLNTRVVKEMIDWLEREKTLQGLQKREREVLWGQSKADQRRKERFKNKEPQEEDEHTVNSNEQQ